MTHPLVVNIRGAGCEVYVGRGSIWGNPFTHGASKFATIKVATREEAIDRYAAWILTQPALLARLPELRAKRLGCHCAPLPCHAEILARMANA
jgi:hypothetical protein